MTTFDKKEYWDRRNMGLPGIERPARPKRIEKGIEVKTGEKKLVDGKWIDGLFPNAEGERMVRTKTGLTRINRKQARQRETVNMATASNYEFQKEAYGFKHVVAKPLNGRKTRKLAFPSYPSKLTNHIRHKQRQIERHESHGKKDVRQPQDVR